MGVLRSGMTLALAAAGGAAYLAYKISKEQNKSFTEALQEVPEEAKRYWNEIQSRGQQAVEAGKEAARRKEQEIETKLAGSPAGSQTGSGN